MRDLIIFIVLGIASYVIYTSGTLFSLIVSLGAFMNLGVLVAGMFYAVGITSPLAVAMFSAYSQTMSPLRIAMAGAVGAMFVDVILFSGMKKAIGKEIRIAGRVFKAPKPKGKTARLSLMLLGGLLLAAPLPDEFALIVLSFSGMGLNRFMVLSFVFKFFGILGIAWALRGII